MSTNYQTQSSPGPSRSGSCLLSTKFFPAPFRVDEYQASSSSALPPSSSRFSSPAPSTAGSSGRRWRSSSVAPKIARDQEREKEERWQAVMKLTSVWDHLSEKYGNLDVEDDDIVELRTGEIIHDRGRIRSMEPRDFGHLADLGLSDEEGQSDDEAVEFASDEDELGVWDSRSRLDAQTPAPENLSDNRNQGRSSISRPPSMSREDLEDLREFERAEEARKTAQRERRRDRGDRSETESEEDERISWSDQDDEVPFTGSRIYEDLADLFPDLCESESEDELLREDEEATRATPAPPQMRSNITLHTDPIPKRLFFPEVEVVIPVQPKKASHPPKKQPPRSRSVPSLRDLFSPSPVEDIDESSDDEPIFISESRPATRLARPPTSKVEAVPRPAVRASTSAPSLEPSRIPRATTAGPSRPRKAPSLAPVPISGPSSHTKPTTNRKRAQTAVPRPAPPVTVRDLFTPPPTTTYDPPSSTRSEIATTSAKGKSKGKGKEKARDVETETVDLDPKYYHMNIHRTPTGGKRHCIACREAGGERGSKSKFCRGRVSRARCLFEQEKRAEVERLLPPQRHTVEVRDPADDLEFPSGNDVVDDDLESLEEEESPPKSRFTRRYRESDDEDEYIPSSRSQSLRPQSAAPSSGDRESMGSTPGIITQRRPGRPRKILEPTSDDSDHENEISRTPGPGRSRGRSLPRLCTPGINDTPHPIPDDPRYATSLYYRYGSKNLRFCNSCHRAGGDRAKYAVYCQGRTNALELCIFDGRRQVKTRRSQTPGVSLRGRIDSVAPSDFGTPGPSRTSAASIDIESEAESSIGRRRKTPFRPGNATLFTPPTISPGYSSARSYLDSLPPSSPPFVPVISPDARRPSMRPLPSAAELLSHRPTPSPSVSASHLLDSSPIPSGHPNSSSPLARSYISRQSLSGFGQPTPSPTITGPRSASIISESAPSAPSSSIRKGILRRPSDSSSSTAPRSTKKARFSLARSPTPEISSEPFIPNSTFDDNNEDSEDDVLLDEVSSPLVSNRSPSSFPSYVSSSPAIPHEISVRAADAGYSFPEYTGRVPSYLIKALRPSMAMRPTLGSSISTSASTPGSRLTPFSTSTNTFALPTPPRSKDTSSSSNTRPSSSRRTTSPSTAALMLPPPVPIKAQTPKRILAGGSGVTASSSAKSTGAERFKTPITARTGLIGTTTPHRAISSAPAGIMKRSASMILPSSSSTSTNTNNSIYPRNNITPKPYLKPKQPASLPRAATFMGSSSSMIHGNSDEDLATIAKRLPDDAGLEWGMDEDVDEEIGRQGREGSIVRLVRRL